jgi:signal transduction histidine kinase
VLVSSERALPASVRAVDLRVVDWILAVLLTAGALVDAASEPRRVLNALAIVSLVVLTGSVAWRRVNAVLATLIAITGLIAFQRASVYAGDGAFELAAIALDFYLLGRRTRGRRSVLVAAVVFACWLAAAAVISYSPAGGTVSEVLGVWALAGGLPFAAGRTLATRSMLTRELEATAARLQDEQKVRAARAAAEERNRIARELHDVIAHNVTVMVIQTTAARRVARGDLEAARMALDVVQSSGRGALVELRLIVGTLRREHDELAVPAAAGLAQLDALVNRARAAGLSVQVHVEGRRQPLLPGLDLVAYRVLQEALTNAIKHSGSETAQVSVSFGAGELELGVTDSGHGPAAGRSGGEPGHGLIGMGERVALFGGELRAEPRAGGGFEVRARIPFDGIISSSPVATSPPSGDQVTARTGGGLRWPWLDPALAGVLLVTLEIAMLASSHRHGPLVLNMVAVAAMALAAIWRRRSPLVFLIVVGTLATVTNIYLTSLSHSPLSGPAIYLIPAYTVAAWEDRRKAVIGLGIFVGGAVGDLIVHHGTAGDFAGAAFTITAAWAAGRAIRARRVVTSELERTSARLAVEREDRARLAVAGERTRIARELHAVVAHSVAAMVVQSEAARSLLDYDPARADTVMGAIEGTGRQTLAEMRRILGVLRHADDIGERHPQPGVDQIYTLIQRARDRGQPVELSVHGEPGTLPAGVDLGIYRILEEGLQSARQQAVGVILRFGAEDLELCLTARCQGPCGWPTAAMRERVALCGGKLHPGTHDEDSWQFVARLPHGRQGALA